MNNPPRSRFLLPGTTKMFFLSLALFMAAGVEVAQAKTLVDSESSGNASPVLKETSHTIRLEETFVSGNQELPKVLYIVPWKQPGGIPDLTLKTEAPELQIFRRLYPPEYRRELKYYELLTAADTEK